MEADLIQGLWVGARLSAMERLSIASFLHRKHKYNLYTYGPVEGLPAGAVLRDASEILPESMIFQYRAHPSYAGFSNYFRYKLLLERGGWWADTDTVCIRPFNFSEPYVFSSQNGGDGSVISAASPIKAPAGSPALAYAWEFCRSRNPQELAWGETGPYLVADMLRRFDLEGYRQPRDVFCPVGPHDWQRLADPQARWHFDVATRAVHLWNELWRRQGWDKDREYPPGCLFEVWKRAFLGQVPMAAHLDADARPPVPTRPTGARR